MKHGTQTRIAERAGVTSALVSQIVNGRKRPSWKTAKRLALATHTDPVLWLEGTPENIVAALENIDYPKIMTA